LQLVENLKLKAVELLHMRLTFAPGENRDVYTSGTRRFAVSSLIMFVLYFLFIAVKRAFL
jgi:hypothetical protein